MKVKIKDLEVKLTSIRFVCNIGKTNQQPIMMEIPGDKADLIFSKQDYKNFEKCMKILGEHYIDFQNNTLP